MFGKKSVADKYSIKGSDLVSQLFFKGTFDPTAEYGAGSVVCNANEMFVYDGNSWIELGQPSPLKPEEDEEMTIKKTKCSYCGGPLKISKAKNGICKCEWCRSENYVW